jgi:hypothetical protein
MPTKISALPAASSVSLSDVLPMVDVSASETQKVTIAQILALGSVTLPLLLDTDVANDHIKYGSDPVAGTFPTVGAIRTDTQVGDGDTTNEANYRWIGVTRIGSANVPYIGSYAYASGAKDLLLGGRWDHVVGTTTTFDSVLVIPPLVTFKGQRFRYYTSTTSELADDRNALVTLTDANPTTVLSSGIGSKKVYQFDVIITASSTTEAAVWKFSVAWEETTAINAADLTTPVYERKSAGASGWSASITAGGAVQVTAANGVKVQVRSALQGNT